MLKNVLWMLFGLFLSMLATAVILLVANQPVGEPVTLLPAPTPQPIIVQVGGAVESPGVYELPNSSRVQQAVEAAGGFSSEADQEAVNLAARLVDGQKVVIPRIAPTPDGSSSMEIPQAATAATEIPVPSPDHPLNINLATVEEVEQLPGIGPTKAAAIVNYRETNGPFQSKNQLLNVTGIGPATLKQIEAYIITGYE